MNRLMLVIFNNHLSRYVVVGGGIAALYFTVLLALVEFTQLPAPVSIGLAYLLSALTRFILHRFWVFNAANGVVHEQLYKYIATLCFVYLCNVLCTEWLVSEFDLPMKIAVIASTFIVTLAAYFISSKWIFR